MKFATKVGIAIALIASLTNPNTYAYRHHLARRYCPRVCNMKPYEVVCRSLCQALPYPEWLTNRYIVHYNLILFSIYITEAEVLGICDVSVGFAGRFINLDTIILNQDSRNNHCNNRTFELLD